jgi:hypothetical protein
LRVLAPFAGDYYFIALAAAAVMWSLSYGLFATLFAILTGPRAPG